MRPAPRAQLHSRTHLHLCMYVSVSPHLLATRTRGYLKPPVAFAQTAKMQPVAAALALVKLPRKKSGQKKKSNRLLGKREPDVPHASVEFDRV